MIDADVIRAGLGFLAIFYGLVFGGYVLMRLLSRAWTWLMSELKGDTVQIVITTKEGDGNGNA